MTAPSSPPLADWAHPCSGQGQALLRDIHDFRGLYSEDGCLTQWADAVHQLYWQAKAFPHPSEQTRRTIQLALERRQLALC